MALVAVIHLGIQTKLTECADTAHAKEEFLLETVLPVAAVEVIGNLAVLGDIGLIVSIHKIEVRAAHFHLPQACSEVTAGESHGCGYPVAVLVQHRNRRNLGKVLGVITGHLISLGAEHLVEVSVAVKKADSYKVHVHIGGFLEVVTSKDTKAAGVNLQGSVQTVLHAEICDGRILTLCLCGHVSVKFIKNPAHAGQEFCVLGELLEALDTYGIQHCKRIVAALVPDFGIDGPEKILCALVPAPPQVL